MSRFPACGYAQAGSHGTLNLITPCYSTYTLCERHITCASTYQNTLDAIERFFGLNQEAAVATAPRITTKNDNNKHQKPFKNTDNLAAERWTHVESEGEQTRCESAREPNTQACLLTHCAWITCAQRMSSTNLKNILHSTRLDLVASWNMRTPH